MDTKLRLEYDREADILHISMRAPYPEQVTEELGNEVLARLNPDTDDVENLEVLFFSRCLDKEIPIEVPVTGNLRLLESQKQQKLSEAELWERIRRLSAETIDTLVNRSRNRIVKVTPAHVEVVNEKTSRVRRILKTEISEVYDELWEHGNVSTEKNKAPIYRRPNNGAWSVTLAILLKVLPDQVESITEHGKRVPAIRLKPGIAAAQENVG
jgi:hypothetical protein